MIVATLEVEKVVKSQNNFRHVFTMLFSDIDKALDHVKYTTDFDNIKLDQIGSELSPQYFGIGYDKRGDFTQVAIFIQKVY